MGLVGSPPHEPSSIAAVTVPDIGGVDTYAEQAPVGIGQDVPLSPGHLLAGIVALGTPPLIGGAHRLAVERATPACRCARGRPDEGVVDALPYAFSPPAAQIILDRLPRRQIMWHQPPRHAGPQEIQDGVHQLARCRLPGPPTGVRIGDQRRDQISLCIGQVNFVASSRGQLLPGA